jgi:hypothetical protein
LLLPAYQHQLDFGLKYLLLSRVQLQPAHPLMFQPAK